MGEKERKTKAEVYGQCKCGLEGEGTVGGGDTNRAVSRQRVTYIDPTTKWENMR